MLRKENVRLVDSLVKCFILSLFAKKKWVINDVGKRFCMIALVWTSLAKVQHAYTNVTFEQICSV